MVEEPLILTLDQGTTSSRAIIFDAKARIIASHQLEFRQHYPADGWVEHDPEDIWSTTLETARTALKRADAAGAGRVVSIGITNQRETVVVWNRQTGRPVSPAIVWQDRRTTDTCAALHKAGHEADITARTGLIIDPYFSAAKIAWILDHNQGARRAAEAGDLAAGTIDSFLIWRLTGGRRHVTDETNASRTSLYNIHSGAWDAVLLNLFKVPAAILPTVQPSSSDFGETEPDIFGRSIPIGGVAGDQQAAAFGQCCFHAGMSKSTYGTGCFVLTNTGQTAIASTNRLLTTRACRSSDAAEFALEGSIFIAGAVAQWLRDELGVIRNASETEGIAAGMDSNRGVYLVPAFTGLGAPYWEPRARGAVYGLTRASDKNTLVRAAMEAVGYQTADLLNALNADGANVQTLRVDGGMAVNSWLMQFVSDLLDIPVERPVVTETTALGAAFLAGLQSGVFDSIETLETTWQRDAHFHPKMAAANRKTIMAGWTSAIETTLFKARLDAKASD